ncbi:hypothetical protein EJP82_25335 [Paenibacillus anaericanus]|uniref:Uncharacterized protein n=1 Tax=Paenibacillus anaericanus TaxID=170367 RepID=A0A433XZ31_9BACL|nr:hypothetical protein [Paenibacillus anaericanus]RUT40343.1 hypothetical protein EJP82_25335 [Paenibacillus anaericanus]
MQNFDDVVSFISQSFLKKDEQLEMPRTIGETSLIDIDIDIDIVKRTARTIRRVGIITVAREYSSIVGALPVEQCLTYS